MENTSILNELLSECPFSNVFDDLEAVPNSNFPVPRLKVGHIRADYDGYRWYNTIWPCHTELETPDICTEIDAVYDRLIAKDAFKDLAALKSFCYNHPECGVGDSHDSPDEYNFYFVGEVCNFWVRLITRKGDYNMYLHAFAKA